MNQSSKRAKIFGLSIAEEIEWGVSEIFDRAIVGKIVTGMFPDIPDGNLPHLNNDPINIEAMIRDRLVDLHKKSPELFQGVSGIGVSTIGVVNRGSLVLDSLVRKKWKKRNSQHVIDFASLFLDPLEGGKRLFPAVTKQEQIFVHNDASARCKTEYLYGHDSTRSSQSVLYIMAGEGVNGAFVYRGDLLETQRHSEMGHITPQLHPDDYAFDKRHSGCPAHTTCFEGLISNARFRQQWGADLSFLPPDHPAWELAAFYLSQLAMIGVLTLDPEKILFGGAHFTGERGIALIDKICLAFKNMNSNYLPHYQTRRPIGELIGRAKFGSGVKVFSALTMGSVAAIPPEDRKATTIQATVLSIAKYRNRDKDK